MGRTHLRNLGPEGRKADCHPDRPHLAKGLCASCYVVAKSRAKKAAMSDAEREALREKERVYFREYARGWRERNPERNRETGLKAKRKAYKTDPVKHRQRAAAYRYGLTIEEYRALLDRANGVCEVCGETSTATLHVDHCHATGVIRGMLCTHCNSALGYAKDDIERLRKLIDYLQGSGQS